MAEYMTGHASFYMVSGFLNAEEFRLSKSKRHGNIYIEDECR